MSPIPNTVPAALILSCVKGPKFDDEVFDYDVGIQLDINDFIVVPTGTKLTLYDGNYCLFDDGVIESYYISNYHGGLFVKVVIPQVSWERIFHASDSVTSYTSRRYHRTLSIMKR
jgi:hypothetical protein